MQHFSVARTRYRIDKYWFFLMFVAGGLSILLLDIFEQPKAASIVVSGTCIVIYAAAALFVRALKARPDQVADNSYYLGLLFTLASLSLALFRFASTAGGTEPIIRNFGIAISSTIIGLALRVLISQFREDPADLEEEARFALAETVRKLRADLDQASAEMQRFADGVRQALQETAVEAAETSGAAIKAATAKFEKATGRLEQRMERTATLLDGNATLLEAAFGRINDSFAQISNKVAAIEVDEHLVTAALSGPVEALTGSIVELQAKAGREGEKLDAGIERLEALHAAVGALGEAADRLSDASRELGSAQDGVAGLTARCSQLTTALESASASATGFGRELDGAAAAEFNRASEAIARLQLAASSAGELTRDKLLSIDAAAASVRAALSGINSEFSNTSEAVEKVRSELADLAGYIVRRLEPQ